MFEREMQAADRKLPLLTFLEWLGTTLAVVSALAIAARSSSDDLSALRGRRERIRAGDEDIA